MKEWIKAYLDLGWKLCALRPGQKGPYMRDWGHLDLDESHWRANPKDGVGLILGRSGVATIDVDDIDAAPLALEAVGVDLEEILHAPDAVRIVSREGRAKLVYRVPEEMRSFVDRKRAINWKKSDGTSFCVIEFRAGSEQLQDVLPPSVHPTTGKPYLWEGNFARMPDLPGELAAIWYDWESASGLMKDADPFRTRVAGVKPKRTIDFSNREGGDVIGKFNDAFSVWDVMSRPSLQAHYVEAGARWARRGSKEMAGVVALECREGSGHHRLYSHHGGDPLIPYASTDAFGMFCLAEHAGDYRAAVKAAAYELGLPSLEIQQMTVSEEQVGALVASGERAIVAKPETKGGELIALPTYKIEDEPDPDAETLIEAPESLVGRKIPVDTAQELAEWIATSVGKAKISAVIQTTLSIVSHLAGRRYVSDRGVMPGVLFALLDDATVNLAPYLRCVDDVLDKLGDYDAGNIGGRIRYLTEKAGNEISTTTGLVEHYRNSPRLLWGSTSIATLLERESRQINPTFQSLLDKLGEIRHGSSLHFAKHKGDTYTIRVPAVAGLWALTPHSVGGLVRTTTRSGLLQQTIVADALGESASAYSGRRELPGGVVAALKEITSRAAKADHIYPDTDDFQVYGPVRVPVEAEAAQIFSDLSSEIKRSCGEGDRLREYPLRGAARGWSEAAEAIALGLAVLRDAHQPMISADLALWAAAWISDCWRLFRERIGYASEDTADAERAILERLRAVGRVGATTSELRRSLRVLRGLSADRRDEILSTLESDGLIASARKTGGTRWYLRKQEK